jgi:hypothetical protein
MLVLLCCPRSKKITPEQMVGAYRAALDTGSDSLTLIRDGTFMEELTFKNGKKLSNHGNWSLRDGSISLEDILAVGPDSPNPNGFVAKTSVVLPVSQLFGRVKSFGVDEWAVFEKM